jgi:lipopolysaccharide/colanic/teichoic acid biosynthesis glycosyltransferase
MTLKRLMDFLLALLGLWLIWPVLILVAVLIKVKMPGGPALFKQKRVGQHGRIFTIYKFRSMNVSHGGSSISIKGESRIPPFGEKLRAYKIDELPGLWNVLIGDMSFVGPRPDVPGYADLLTGKDRDILKLKPGITGPASLKYKNEEEILAEQIDPIIYNDTVIYPDKIRINLLYLERHNLKLDFQLIIQTVLGGFDENKW